MRVIHCPPNEDPPVYARRVAKGRGLAIGGGNLWLVLGILAFVAVGVLWGPLKPRHKTPEHPVTPAAVVATPVASDEALAAPAEPALCKLPAGGMLAAGWESWIGDGTQVKRVRCKTDGTLQEIEAATP